MSSDKEAKYHGVILERTCFRHGIGYGNKLKPAVGKKNTSSLLEIYKTLIKRLHSLVYSDEFAPPLPHAPAISNFIQSCSPTLSPHYNPPTIILGLDASPLLSKNCEIRKR